MAKIQEPDPAEYARAEEPWKLLENPLSQYFAELAEENGLEVRINPEPPYERPVSLREAYDSQTGTKIYLTLILGKAPEHDLKLEFGKPIPTERVTRVCESLGIDDIVINGNHYKKGDGRLVKNIFNRKTKQYENFLLEDQQISQIGFCTTDFNSEKIKQFGGYLPSLLGLLRIK
ncbi:MAG: hypothetical protein KJ597_01405 [Nanoarchaeota archaeon]|nr:hypothetical protein [Nanoarchaeota archaeon]MBU1622209.1 hypothetical protein [Nanoarchaeota archaeon]